MIKQNGYLENLLAYQNSLSPAKCLFKCMDKVNWTEWVLEKKIVFKVVILCVCVGEVRVVMVWVDGSVGELMRCEWRSLGVGVLERGGVWVGGWVSVFFTSGKV